MPSNLRIRRLGPLLLAGLAALPVAAQEERDTVRVFFIGNSYTDFNSLPGLVQGISEALEGPVVATASHTHGGYRLSGHLTDGHLPGAFRTESPDGGEWDVVVLQEQSALATTTDTLSGELGSPDEFRNAVRGLATMVRNMGAAPALYMTWAKKRWPAQLAQISDAYLGAATEIDAPVAPVGAAWAAARSRRPDLDLFVGDGSHPNPVGSYLAACVIYATLTGRTPVGAPRELWGAPWWGGGRLEAPGPTLLVSLSPDDATFLQEVAWTVVGEWGPASLQGGAEGR